MASGGLQQFLYRICDQHPHAVAFTHQGQRVTYRELDEMANLICRGLIARGFAPGAVFAVLLERRLEMVAALLGLFRGGYVFVPLDHATTDPRTSTIAQRLAPDGAIVDPTTATAAASWLEDAATRSVEIADLLSGSDRTRPDVVVDPDAGAYIYFTSGTTGVPKGILGRQRGLEHFIRWEASLLGLERGVAVAQLVTPTHDPFFRDILLPLAVGGTISVPPAPVSHIDANSFLGWCGEAKIGVIHSVPSLFATWIPRLDDHELESLRFVLLAGEPVRIPDVKRWMDRFGARITLINLYGPTETTLAKCFHVICPADLETPFVPVGKPLPDTTLLILDPDGKPCGEDVVGEVYISTPYRSLGYYRDPEQTNRLFVQNPLSDDPSDIVYRTGDLGRWMKDGNLRLLGRRDSQIKIRGNRVELGEIEAHLQQHPQVNSAVITLYSRSAEDIKIIAYVVSESGKVPPSELRAFLGRRVPEYMLPSRFVFLDALPLNSNGKVDRNALPIPDWEKGETAYVAPRTPTEELLAGIWADELHVSRPGVHDDFFELGGHSLIAAQVMFRLGAALGVPLSLPTLLRSPTIAALAGIVDSLRAGPPPAPPQAALSVVPRTEAIPLSLVQEGLWFLEQSEKLGAAYNLSLAYRLRGPLQKESLTQAVAALVARHESLRTTFPLRDGVAVQAIVGSSGTALAEDDARGLPTPEQEALRSEWTATWNVPFDLARGPLFRARLLHLGEAEHLLGFFLHHMVADGASLDVLARELGELYEAFTAGRGTPRVSPTVQYADFAVWQRTMQTEELLASELLHWKNTLAGAPVLELPTDRPRPPVQPHRGAQFTFSVPSDVYQPLKALGRTCRSTPFMTLLAAYQVLLGRWSGQDDFCVGTPIAGRTHPELLPLIGYFANILVMRADLSGRPSFSEALARARDTALTAYAHSEVPVWKVVAALNPERDRSRNPLFQTLFTMHDEQAPLVLPGVDVELLPSQKEGSRFDLSLDLWDSKDELKCKFEYCTELFDLETIEAMAGHFEVLLRSILDHPTRSVWELELLTESEKRRIVVEWNDTATNDAPEAWIEDLFQEQARKTPDSIAIVFGEKSLSYRELDHRSNQLAHRLRSLGVQRSARVGLHLHRSLDMMVALFAILKAGGAYVPLDPSFPAERLAFMLQDAEVGVLVTETALSNALALSPSVHKVVVDEDAALLQSSSEVSVPRVGTGSAASDIAYVIYTSGSTGQPKGVQVPHRAVVNFLISVATTPGISAQDTLLAVTTLSFDIAVLELLLPLTVGARVVLASRECTSDGARLLDLLKRESVTVMQGTPSSWRLLLDAGWEGSASFKVICGGEALPADLARALVERSASAWNMYGPTETTVWSSVYLLPNPFEGPVLIGKPLANTQLYVVDGHLQPVPVGVRGELYIGGYGVTLGYLRRPELTAERFIDNVFHPGTRLYKTGDDARFRPDGNVEYLGRNDDQVKLRGFRIELGEIEAALATYPLVRDAVAVVRKDTPGDARLVAYVVPKSGETIADDELRRHLRRSLPEYMLPQHFVALDSLPLTPNGKADRKALPAPHWKGAHGEQVPPRTPTEEILADIWAAELHIPRPGIHDNFFKIGGHSLIAARTIFRIRETMGVSLSLTTLFDAPTIAMLAREIQALERSSADGSSIPVVERRTEFAASLYQERLCSFYEMFPGNPAFHFGLGLRLEGELDRDVLQASIREILRRHDVLRTTFSRRDGALLQIVAPADEMWSLPVVDLSATSAPDRVSQLHDVADGMARRPFDLERGPLFRAVLVRLQENEHALCLGIFHASWDVASSQIFEEELSLLYSAFCAGRPSPLPELRIQYGDYSVWQRQWMRSARALAQVSYWRNHLEGTPEEGKLPFDRSPAPVELPSEGHHSSTLSPEIRRALVEIGAKDGCTLHMMVFSVFNALLHHYSGQESVVVGVPIATRSNGDTTGLIGYFINNLAIHTRVEGSVTFRELMARVRKATLGAYENHEVPLQPTLRMNLVRRLYQVRLNFIPARGDSRPTEAGPLKVTRIPIRLGASPIDLELFVHETSEGLGLSFQYKSNLFDASTVASIADDFKMLSERVVLHPEQSLRALLSALTLRPHRGDS